MAESKPNYVQGLKYLRTKSYSESSGIMNYRFLTTETNSKALYILLFFYNLISKAICSDCTDFCLQIFVYNCIFRKKEKNNS